MTGDWVLFAPMWLEARALRRGLPAGAPLRRTGRGLARAARAAAAERDTRALAVAGIAGGLVPALRPGDVVVATEVRRDGPDPAAPVRCPAAPIIASALRRRGLRVHLGPVVSAARLVDGPRRTRLADTGALAVDTESAALLAGTAARPVACLRVVADVPPDPLFRPATAGRVRTALRVLSRVAPAVVEWAAATTARRVALADAVLAHEPTESGEVAASALTNRPAAPGGVVADADVVLVLDPASATNSRRLVETSRRAGTPAYLVDDVGGVDPRWLAGAHTIGVTVGAAAPPRLVDQTVAALVGLGVGTVREHVTRTENVRFILPKEVRSS